MPLRDDKRLPVLEHRIVANNINIEVPDNEISTKDEDKEHRKSKKKSKSSKDRNVRSEKKSEENGNSVDLWLVSDTSPKIVGILGSDNCIKMPSEVELEKKDESRSAKSSKSKGNKNESEHETKHKKKGRKVRDESEANKDKTSSGYEETAGISTPSKEILPSLSTILNTPDNPSTNVQSQLTLTDLRSSYEILAADKMVKLTYELKQLPYESEKIVILLVLTNIGTNLLKELDFAISDTSTLKLFRNGNDFGMKLPFQLPPNSSNETQFALSVTDVTFVQKLRGTLTYMIEEDTRTSQEKLDFVLTLPCSSFMIGHLSHRDILTELLSRGQLTEKKKSEVDSRGQEFSQMLTKICYKCHLTLVERIEQTASLYGHSLKGHHVCLLLKHNNGKRTLVIEGKSDNNLLLSEIVEEITKLVS